MRVIVAALSLLPAIACFGGSTPISGDTRNVSGTTLSLRVEPSVVEAGQSVTLRLRLVNNTGNDVELTYPSAQDYDFWVTRGGREVWRWSEGRSFAQVVQTQRVPGQSGDSWSEIWVAEAAGEYTAHARLLAQGYGGELTGEVEVR